MFEEIHNRFLDIDEMVEKLFSKNEDVFERVLGMPDYTKENIDWVTIEKNAGFAYLRLCAASEDEKDTIFILSDFDDEFNIEVLGNDNMRWRNGEVCGDFTLNALENFTFVMDELRDYFFN